MVDNWMRLLVLLSYAHYRIISCIVITVSNQTHIIINKIFWCFGYVFMGYGFSISFMRTFRLYFWYNFQIIQLQTQWKKHLESKANEPHKNSKNIHNNKNKNNKKESTSFFVKYKKLYDVKYLGKICGLFIFISTIFMTSMAFSSNKEKFNIGFHVFGLLMFVSMAEFYQYFVIRLNKQPSVDNFLIRKELNGFNYTMTIVFIIFLIPYIIFNDPYLEGLVISYGLTFGSAILAFMSVYMMINHIKHANQDVTDMNKENKQTIHGIKLFDVLQNKTGL